MYLNDIMTHLNNKKTEETLCQATQKNPSRINLTCNEQHVCQIKSYSCLFMEYLGVF